MKKIKINEVKQYCFSIVLIGFLSLSAVSIAGCAGKTRTSTVTTQTNGNSAGSTTSTVTTQKEVTTDAHPRGVIGGIFYTIGQIILWPFKVIGSLFS